MCAIIILINRASKLKTLVRDLSLNDKETLCLVRLRQRILPAVEINE